MNERDNYSIQSCSGPLSNHFLSLNQPTFKDAANFTSALPYGRNENRADFNLVFKERRGTCSTKHALLKQLCMEQKQYAFKLYIGMYEMNETNTPGVGDVLRKYELPGIPEAHCYLARRNKCYDFTTVESQALFIHKRMLASYEIDPPQIGDYKIQLHRSFIASWLKKSRLHDRFSLRDIWEIRELCIGVLSPRYDHG